MNLPVKHEAAYLRKAGWTRTGEVRMGIAVIRWTKGGLTCSQTQALEIQECEDRQKQTRINWRAR